MVLLTDNIGLAAFVSALKYFAAGFSLPFLSFQGYLQLFKNDLQDEYKQMIVSRLFKWLGDLLLRAGDLKRYNQRPKAPLHQKDRKCKPC